MNPCVIPHELLAPVYSRAMKGHSSRAIAQWLKREHLVDASHSAVLGCIRRAASEKRAMEDLLDGAPALAPPGSPPDDRLLQLDCDLDRIARKALREGDLRLALQTRVAQVRAASNQLQQLRHDGIPPEAKPRLAVPAPEPSVLGAPEEWREPTAAELAAKEERDRQTWEEWEAAEEARIRGPVRKGSTLPGTLPPTLPAGVTP